MHVHICLCTLARLCVRVCMQVSVGGFVSLSKWFRGK